MITEVINISKFRDGLRVGDDVPVVVPGVLYGVFDGATDPRGTIVDGIGAGRLAALTVAHAMTDLAFDPDQSRRPGAEIIAQLSRALASRTAPLGLSIPPSTTLAVALDCGDDWRFLAVGDTGIRLNGREVLQREKIIDAVSTGARVRVFRDLLRRGTDPDAAEYAARRAIMLGLDAAEAEGILRPGLAAEIIAQTTAELSLGDHAAEIREFLSAGIQSQYRLGNRVDHVLGFDTLNGTLPCRGELLDMTRPKSGIRSIEIFSDGYPDLPTEVSASAWEASFRSVDSTDYHRIGAFAAVKGSTSDEYFDDRTVIILANLPGATA